MSSPMTVTAARMTLVVGLSLLSAACSLGQDPSAMVFDNASDNPQATDRFGRNGLATDGQAVAVSRVYIDSDDLESTAPEAYTVVRGDTLWDISDRFLKEPWRWTEIWSYNPQINNPHLIYPGDILALEYVNGKPTLRLIRDGELLAAGPGEPTLGAANPANNGAPRVKLSPRIRSESLDEAVPTISAESIRQFLIHPRVLDTQTIAEAPYVIANNDGRLISSLGTNVYVRGQINRNQTSYGIFRPGKALIDPINGALLGHEVIHVADATLLNVGDPSTLMINSNKMETMEGDILLASSEKPTAHNYVTRLPQLRGEGRIVSLFDAISQSGRNQVVVLNMGQESNIQEGDVLAIETRGRQIVDERGISNWERVTLPNTRTGVVMVFKTFDKVSYALVMESTRPVLINDIITGI